MCLINQIHNGCFDSLNRVENVVDCLFVTDLCQFSLHIYTLIVVKFHLWRDKIVLFFGISTVGFLVNSSDGVFLLRVSDSAKFFSAVHTMCKFGNFVGIS